MAKVRMLQQVTGNLNDVPYPAPGRPFEVSDDVAEKMYENGTAQPWGDKVEDDGKDGHDLVFVPTMEERRPIGMGRDPHIPGSHVTEDAITVPAIKADRKDFYSLPADVATEKPDKDDGPTPDATSSPVGESAAPVKSTPTASERTETKSTTESTTKAARK